MKSVRGRNGHGLRNISSFRFRFTPEITGWRGGAGVGAREKRRTRPEARVGVPLKGTIFVVGMGPRKYFTGRVEAKRNATLFLRFHTQASGGIDHQQRCVSTLTSPPHRASGSHFVGWVWSPPSASPSLPKRAAQRPSSNAIPIFPKSADTVGKVDGKGWNIYGY